MLENKPPLRDKSCPRAVRLADAMLPHIQDGTLTVSVGVGTTERELQKPIIEIENSGKVISGYSSHFLGTVLDTPWPSSALAVERPIPVAQNPTELQILDRSDFERPEGVSHKQFRMGEVRDLASIFGALVGAKIEKIRIIDRYAFAAGPNINALEPLLCELLKRETANPLKVDISHGPAGNSSDESLWRNSAFQFVLKLKQQPEYTGVSVVPAMRSYREPKGDKHDRRIIVEFTPQSNSNAETQPLGKRVRVKNKPTSGPKRRTLIVELTGGVSHLMNEDSETNVFYWET